jgi:hypothetical protein
MIPPEFNSKGAKPIYINPMKAYMGFMYSKTMVGEAPNLPQRLPISQFIVIASNNENVGCLWGRLRAYSPRLNGVDSINL